jgi:DNA primase
MASSAIEQIKERLDIVSEIGAVVALRRSGKAYKGLCPFHSERTPSFYVFPETRTWRCFGCNEGGDLFAFVIRNQGLDFSAALALLAEKAGVDPGSRDGEPHEPSAQSQARARLRTLNDAAAVWFHHQLLTAASATYARSYLQTRGVSNETIERFRLGYAPDGDHLARYLIEQGFEADEVVEAGLARRREGDDRGSLYDYFRNRILFTIRDARDQTIGFGARELGGGTPKYLNTPQTLLFDKSATLYAFDQAREAIRRLDQVVVVEGYMDALIAHQYGYRNTVACIGSAITPKHVTQIKRLTRRLILALDPDAAGEAATLRAIEIAQDSFDRVVVPVPVPDNTKRATTSARRKPPEPRGMIRFEEQVDADIRVLQLPDGIDPDEFIRADPAAWQEQIDRALPLVEFLFTTQLADLDLRTPEGKQEAGRRLFPVVGSIGDRVKRDAYLRQLAGLLRISERDAQAELRRSRRTSRAHPSEGDRPDTALGEKYYTDDGAVPGNQALSGSVGASAGAVKALEDYCIGLLLAHPEVLAEVCVILEPSDFWGTETQALFTTLASAPRPVTPRARDVLLAQLPDVVRAEAERLCALGAMQAEHDAVQFARTARQVAYRLKRQRLTDAITELSYLQREAADQGDRETELSLREQMLRFSQVRRTLDAAHVLQT